MIYVDTSVVLAELFGEERHPSHDLWREPLVSSRLLTYECWVRTHARGRGRTHGATLAVLLAKLQLVELAPEALARATEPFRSAVKTLDALHLSTALWLATQAEELQVASYDTRLRAAAEAEGLPLYPL